MKQDKQQWHKNLTQRIPLKKYSIFSFLGLPKSLNCTRKGLTSHGCSKTRSQRENIPKKREYRSLQGLILSYHILCKWDTTLPQ